MLKVVGASWQQTRISTYILAAIALFGIVIIIWGGEMSSTSANDGIYSATVFWKKGVGYRMEFWGQGNDLDEIPKGSARAYYCPDLLFTGWSKIEIESHENYPDWVQAYSAGLLEGSLTWQLIYWHWQNTVEKACENIEEECEIIRDILRKNSEYLRTRAVQLSEINPYWHQIRLFYAQIDGIETGWRYAVKRSRQNADIPSEDFLWMNVLPDILDIARKLHIGLDESIYQQPTLGSSLIKLFNSTETSIHIAHSSSKMYSSMLRIVKKYTLNYHETGFSGSDPVPGSIMMFSSYPGIIGSQDDMYIMNSITLPNHNLIITGTPITNLNPHLWDNSNIEDKVLTSIKVLVSNRLAKNGRMWWENFSMQKSDTGLKQWLILDMSKKTENENNSINHREGLLWVIEEIPEIIKGSDQSEYFRNRTYWANYGLSFYEGIQKETGLIKAGNESDMYSYSKNPKAKLFKQCRNNCSTTDEILNIIRHEIDPSENFVGARGDLYPSPIPYGVIDNKILTGSLGKILDFKLISGPIYSEKELENFANYLEDETSVKPFILPFRWSKSYFSNIPHYGQPDLWQFLPLKPSWIWH